MKKYWIPAGFLALVCLVLALPEVLGTLVQFKNLEDRYFVQSVLFTGAIASGLSAAIASLVDKNKN